MEGGYDENSLRSRAAYHLLVGGIILVYGILPLAAAVWVLVTFWPVIQKLFGGG